jgi:hypothetical protein
LTPTSGSYLSAARTRPAVASLADRRAAHPVLVLFGDREGEAEIRTDELRTGSIALVIGGAAHRRRSSLVCRAPIHFDSSIEVEGRGRSYRVHQQSTGAAARTKNPVVQPVASSSAWATSGQSRIWRPRSLARVQPIARVPLERARAGQVPPHQPPHWHVGPNTSGRAR